MAHQRVLNRCITNCGLHDVRKNARLTCRYRLKDVKELKWLWAAASFIECFRQNTVIPSGPRPSSSSWLLM